MQGLKVDDNFYDTLYDTVINNYLDDGKLEQMKENNSILNLNKKLLKQAQEELIAEGKKLDRVMSAYENGNYTLEQFDQRKKPIEENIKKLKKKVIELEHEAKGVGLVSEKELRGKIEEFKKNWNKSTTPKEQNDLLKSVVKKIYYDRNDDDVTLDIEYI